MKEEKVPIWKVPGDHVCGPLCFHSPSPSSLKIPLWSHRRLYIPIWKYNTKNSAPPLNKPKLTTPCHFPHWDDSTDWGREETWTPLAKGPAGSLSRRSWEPLLVGGHILKYFIPLNSGSLLGAGLPGHFYILCFCISLFEFFNHLYM